MSSEITWKWDEVVDKSKMSEQQLIATIEKVAGRLSGKFPFGYYDSEDIGQEIFILACSAIIHKYDGIRPLENFLSVHCRNRIINFRRDNYFRGGNDISEKQEKINETRRNIMNALDIEEVQLCKDYGMLEAIAQQELFDTIDALLPTDLRRFYLQMRAGVQIPQHRKTQVEATIMEIVENENWAIF